MDLGVFVAFTYKVMKLKADWNRYALVLFNIIQNAVKFNIFKGEIAFVLKCLPFKPSLESDVVSRDQYVLETEIIDSGLGISNER